MSVFHRLAPPPIWVDKQPYFLLGKSSNQTVNTATLDKIEWQTIVIPTTFFDVDLTNNRVGVLANAKYQFNTRYVGDFSSGCTFELHVDSIFEERLTLNNPSADGCSLIFSDIILTVGQFVEIFASHGSGASKDWNAAADTNALAAGFEGRMII